MSRADDENRGTNGATPPDEGSAGEGRWPSSTLFIVLITGLVVALGILALLGLFA